MEHLNKIAQGIVIGNSNVWNFLDYAVNRNCDSLITYTQKNDYLKANLFNNFNGGDRRRYLTGIDIDDTSNYAPGKFGNYLTKTNVNGGMIGELYSVNDNSNSELKFITKEKFISFNKDIRNLSLNLNLIDYDKRFDEKAISLESYLSDIGDFDILPEAKNVYNFQDKKGEEYNVVYNERQNTNRTLNEVGKAARTFNEETKKSIKKALNTDRGIDEETKYKGVEITSKFPVYKGPIGGKIKERIESLKSKLSIDEVANDIRYKKFNDNFISLNNLIRQNTFILKNFKYDDLYLGSLQKDEIKSPKDVEKISIDKNIDIFSEGLNTNNVNKLVIRTEEGLKDYYADLRENYNYVVAGLRYPWNNTLWSALSSYGVDLSEVGGEYYTVDGERNDIGTSISPSFIGGSHITKINNNISYSYFQEPNSDKTIPNLNAGDGVYNGTSVILSDYNDASRLLQRTNELFKDFKINTLINRFHTDVKDVDSDFITSYDNTYGISRGRNLLKKDENGNVIVDKSSGYDNPYCRVWTAHHQYSKLRDRVRPFVGEDGRPLSLSKTQEKYGGLRPYNGSFNLSKYSVLRDDGYVNITSTHDGAGNYNNYQKYMFSIENLAWKDNARNALSSEQIGPNKGRIMWFPPYNLKFSENVNVAWNTTSFIGRGEEIYTYTNTVRSGTLDFTLLIDHPSILNKYRGTSSDVANKEEIEQDILRYFAGCGLLTDDIDDTKNKESNNNNGVSIETKPTPFSEQIAYIVFFPNEFSGIDYSDTLDTIIDILSKYDNNEDITKTDKSYNNYSKKISEGFKASDYDVFIRNNFFHGSENIKIRFLTDLFNLSSEINGKTIFGYNTNMCKIKNIAIKGFASSHGNFFDNIKLANNRRNILKRLIKYYSQELNNPGLNFIDEKASVINVTDISNNDINLIDAKLARAAYVIFDIGWGEDTKPHNDSTTDGITVTGFINNVKSGWEKFKKNPTGAITDSLATMIEFGEKLTPENSLITMVDKSVDFFEDVLDVEIVNKPKENTYTKTTVEKTGYTYDNEYLYFSSLRSDSLEYKSIVDKVRFFEPGFHSITPEGFNARLTFLHQCTRQGPTNAVNNGNVTRRSDDYQKFAGNLAFGRAPYCVLRIGDFFNTKICIDSLSINYDNSGVQWDLNPEGVGVQPMFANVSITFKFIGGQDISGPIERLQNAVTANYYANASVYSRHADNENSYYDAIKDTNIN